LAFFKTKPFEIQHRRSSEIIPAPKALTYRKSSQAARSNSNAIDPQSLQLILEALYHNFVYRPLKSLSNFLFVTKSIYFKPSVAISERDLFQY